MQLHPNLQHALNELSQFIETEFSQQKHSKETEKMITCSFKFKIPEVFIYTCKKDEQC